MAWGEIMQIACQNKYFLLFFLFLLSFFFGFLGFYEIRVCGWFGDGVIGEVAGNNGANQSMIEAQV